MTTEELEMCVGVEVAANAMRKAQYHHEYMCPRCHGSGIHWTRRGEGRDCWCCDGTGTIAAPRIDRVYYRSLLFAARRGEDINEYARMKNTSSDLVRETREEHGMNDTTSRSPRGFFRGVCGKDSSRTGFIARREPN